MSLNQLYDATKNPIDVRVNDLIAEGDVELRNNVAVTGDLVVAGDITNPAGPFNWQYEEFSGVLNMTGAWTGNIAYNAVKIGKFVNLQLEGIVDNSTANANLTSSNFPASLAPAGGDLLIDLISVEDNTAIVLGACIIGNQLTLGIDADGAPFTNGGTCGLDQDVNICYNLS